MKYLGKKQDIITTYWSSIVQMTYWSISQPIEKVLKHFYIDKLYPLNSPMNVRALEVNKDLFRPKEENEELFGLEVPYLIAFNALMYLANCIKSNIAFSVIC